MTWRNGEIRPFKQGIVLNSGVSARISDVTVSDPHVGIRVEPGAVATLEGNRIERSSGTGIKLQRGAAGRAQSNKVTCVSGECLCYGDDCDDDEEDIDSGGFKLSGNSCRRDRRGRFF